MKHLLAIVVTLLLFAITQTAYSAFPDKYSHQRQLFLEAEKALEAGDRMKFWAGIKTLRDYPLYPYLRYTDLKSRLDDARNDEVLTFIEAFSDSPVSFRLRTLWLKSLAAKQQWHDFLRFYKPNQLKSLNCLKERAKIATDRRYDSRSSVRTIWLTGYSLPDECNALIKDWHNKGLVTEKLYKQRVKLALRKNNFKLARYLMKGLPVQARQDMQVWLSVYKDSRALQKPELLTHKDAVELIQAKISALAWYYPDQAITFAESLSHYKNLKKVRGKVEQVLAVALARRFHPQAQYWLNRVPKKYINSRVVKWRIRNALKREDWQQVLVNIARLEPGAQNRDRWQYWQARALSKLGQTQKANTIYRRLAANRSYEGFLASDILGLAYSFKHKDLDFDRDYVSVLSKNEGMARARELMILKRFTLARSEWNTVLAKLTITQKASAAWLAYQWGWSNQTIVTLAGLSEWDDLELRFPLKHMSEIHEHTRSTIIDPALALAVIRQESAFLENARSSSNARGLMQLLPSTARQVARQMNVKPFDLKQLNRPDVNIKLGVSYLHKIKNELMQHPVLAIAAYNAGKSRVVDWVDKTKSMPIDVWVENVPFRETRNYCRNILAYSVVYEKRLGLHVRRIAERMPPIPDLSVQDGVNI